MTQCGIKEIEFELKVGNITEVVKLYDVMYVNIPEYDEQESYEDLVFQNIEIDGQEIDDVEWEEFSNYYIDHLYKKGIETFLNKLHS